MTRTVETVLRDQGRGVVGALLVSVELLFTMEMWWLGWGLSAAWLVAYVVLGLGVVLAVTRSVGFKRDREDRRSSVGRAVTDFMELVLQSFVTAFGVLFLFGVVDLGESLYSVTRLGLVFVVPLGFGAALANALLRDTEESRETNRPLSRHLGVVAVGALFVSMTIAPTDEIALLAAYASWTRLGLILVVSVLVAYLVLFELEFQGHESRTADTTVGEQVGDALITYAVGIVVAASLLAASGQFRGSPAEVWVQMTIVLALPASIGASGARVVL